MMIRETSRFGATASALAVLAATAALSLEAKAEPDSAVRRDSMRSPGSLEAVDADEGSAGMDSGRWPCPNAACLIPTVLCDDSVPTGCNSVPGFVTISGVPMAYGSWKNVVYKEEEIRRLTNTACPPGFFNSTSHCYEEQYWTGPACSGSLVHVKYFGQRPTGTQCPTRPTPVPNRPERADERHTKALEPILDSPDNPAPQGAPR